MIHIHLYTPSMATILLFFSLLFVCQRIRADTKYVDHKCSILYNGDASSVQERNKVLTSLLEDALLQSSKVKFYNNTGGVVPNKVYVLFQCRDDLAADDDNCALCIDLSKEKLLSECDTYSEGLVWYRECMIRYAYRNLFSLVETSPAGLWRNDTNVSNVDDFMPILAQTMDGLIKEASIGNKGGHFATRIVNITRSKRLYCLGMCTPDLDTAQCRSCLNVALANLTDFNGTSQAMAFLPSCTLRYKDNPFFVTNLTTDDPDDKKRSLKPIYIIAIASAASVIGLAIIATILWILLRQRKPKESSIQKPEDANILGDDVEGNMEEISRLESLQFDFNHVMAATCDFSVKNKLGQGGFGEVYKGNLFNGKEVAVKRLSRNSQQGAFEFKNEVRLLAKLQHRNLVRLFGYCISGSEKILIYEYLLNSSLDHFLRDPDKRASLKWELRFKIISGIARGLLYLHEDSRLKIIHRDLKSSNILLDEAMDAKIADFGLAKLINIEQTQGSTVRIAGTYGYMAPEYAMAGHFSAKSDVYSFGVIVLEIMSSQTNSSCQQPPDEGLLHRAWRLWNEDAISEFIDPMLDNVYCEQEVKLCLHIGLLCVQDDATLRPRMATVVAMLNGQSITLPPPSAPLLFSIGLSDATTNTYDSLRENNGDQHKKSDHGAFTGTMDMTNLHPR